MKLNKLQQNDDSKQIDLSEQLRLFIEECKELRIRSVTQGESPPWARFDNWRSKVMKFLSSNFASYYDRRLDACIISGNTKQGFTGMATPQQIDLWKKCTAALEWLENLQKQIQDAK